MAGRRRHRLGGQGLSLKTLETEIPVKKILSPLRALVCLLVLSAPRVLLASPVTWSFTSHLSLSKLVFEAGTPVQGWFTFDSDAESANLWGRDPARERYFTFSPIALEVTVGSGAAASVFSLAESYDPESHYILVADKMWDEVDGYQVHAPVSGPSVSIGGSPYYYPIGFTLTLWDYDGGMFEDTTLPVVPPGLGSLTQTPVWGISYFVGNRYIQIGGAIESLTAPSPTPEPSTLVLAALGLAGAALMRRKLKK